MNGVQNMWVSWRNSCTGTSPLPQRGLSTWWARHPLQMDMGLWGEGRQARDLTRRSAEFWSWSIVSSALSKSFRPRACLECLSFQWLMETSEEFTIGFCSPVNSCFANLVWECFHCNLLSGWEMLGRGQYSFPLLTCKIVVLNLSCTLESPGGFSQPWFPDDALV